MKMTKEEFLEQILTRREAERYLELSSVAFQHHLRQGNITPVKEVGQGKGKVQLFWKEDLNTFRRKNNMTKFSSLNVTNSTIIERDGKELRTTQDPYIDRGMYKAIAVDEDDKEYEVKWEITNHETTDESETCDWDHPAKVTAL
jgi:hypothetical protein